jgi:hypothetical protein
VFGGECGSAPNVCSSAQHIATRVVLRREPIPLTVRENDLDAKLLDRVLLKYYWLREQNELRTKPSASEHRLDLEG